MLLDTSGLYSYLDTADFRHGNAVSLLQSASIRITHNYVVAELVALCQARGLNRLITVKFAESLAMDTDIRLIWVGEQEHRAALHLLMNRPDKTYSLCDAVSFLLMRRHGITDALTTDRHFDQEGFARLLAP